MREITVYMVRKLKDGSYGTPSRVTEERVPEFKNRGWLPITELEPENLDKIPGVKSGEFSTGQELSDHLETRDDNIRTLRASRSGSSEQAAVAVMIADSVRRHELKYHAKPAPDSAPQAKPGAKPRPRT